ncbi:hypothetical protein JH06_4464 [Blastocystis sp. subtype 4]|uniref:hypothetical protein n=1 Tax=Blastocystis sp. subtype 4 TaxID=944170 RepID=UPI000711648C|nr:hypothetical protein JH06_4464 [Blastocystis sp. subtype 4]KNB42665.1 hypothetical protein JH06_4464 [Blastocystis sp. subtype 4]|eukprot:XP_014526108.1 hypothetical protein JH06_4464 [Blastocystis sp. subtype 4]
MILNPFLTFPIRVKVFYKLFLMTPMHRNYDEAIKVIDKSAQDFYNERVYCLYMKQKYEEALALLNKRNADDQNSKLLKAQVLYRLERYDESLKLYQAISRSVAELWNPDFNSQSYEVLYNYGTLLIYSGQLTEAESVLRRALQLGRQQLNEGEEQELDVVDEGEETELDPIRIQLAFIASRHGDNVAAEKSLMNVLNHGSSSKVIQAIATSNLVAVRGCVELTESAKR